jgi:hypothetical protein
LMHSSIMIHRCYSSCRAKFQYYLLKPFISCTYLSSSWRWHILFSVLSQFCLELHRY